MLYSAHLQLGNLARTLLLNGAPLLLDLFPLGCAQSLGFGFGGRAPFLGFARGCLLCSFPLLPLPLLLRLLLILLWQCDVCRCCASCDMLSGLPIHPGSPGRLEFDVIYFLLFSSSCGAGEAA